jgi:hypothetical protein
MSRGLGAMARAVARAIAACKKRNERNDAFMQRAGPPPDPRPVVVTPWSVCMASGVRPQPSRSRLNSAVRAMHSFVGKFRQHGLVSGSSRGPLTLYESGDELGAMWAKLCSQRETPPKPSSTPQMTDLRPVIWRAPAPHWRRNPPIKHRQEEELPPQLHQCADIVGIDGERFVPKLNHTPAR